jgi:hypothetical protein
MAKIMPHSGRLALSATDGGQRAGETAAKCGTFGMRRFARTLRQDIAAEIFLDFEIQRFPGNSRCG